MSTESDLRILLVDGDDAALERYVAALEPTYDVASATTGEAALDELTGGRPPDAVVLSSRLEGYGTEAVIREIRYRELDCRLLLLDDDPDTVRSWQGVDGQLTRPLAGDTLRGLGDALEALDRIPVVAARYRRLTGVRPDDEARTHAADDDGGSITDAKAELDRLHGVLADAGIRSRQARPESRDATHEPGAVRGPMADSRAETGVEAS